MDTRIAEIANTIVEQLGGRRFKVMTGAKNFVGVGIGQDRVGGVSFRLPGGGGYCKDGINFVSIELTPRDEYTMIFGRTRGSDYKVISMHRDVYCDNLRETFTEATGLHTSL
jgi:hypothetical protein